MEALFTYFPRISGSVAVSDPGWKKFGSGIRDGKKSDPGSGKQKVGSGKENVGYRIRDKHPGSATLISVYSTAFIFNSESHIFNI